jgi:hypothetical protein
MLSNVESGCVLQGAWCEQVQGVCAVDIVTDVLLLYRQTDNSGRVITRSSCADCMN